MAMFRSCFLRRELILSEKWGVQIPSVRVSLTEKTLARFTLRADATANNAAHSISTQETPSIWSSRMRDISSRYGVEMDQQEAL